MTAVVLDRLTEALEKLSPQVRQAAEYVLDNPGEVAVTSMRGLAQAADVKPNTLMRLARAVGFDGYDEFREPFRREAAEATPSFPDRARFLRSLDEGGRHGYVLARMAEAAIGNLEALFASLDVDELSGAAELIDASRQTFVLGVGTAKPVAEQFVYMAGQAFRDFHAIPTIGLAIDDVGRMLRGDVLIAMTVSPYRVEIVRAVELAHERRVPVIAITNSRSSPIARRARHTFVVPNDSPLPFSSSVATGALLEVLLAFLIADSVVDVVARIDRFHATRQRASIYTT